MYDAYSNLVTSVHLFRAEILSGTEEGLGDLGEEEGRKGGGRREEKGIHRRRKERDRERERERVNKKKERGKRKRREKEKRINIQIIT